MLTKELLALLSTYLDRINAEQGSNTFELLVIMPIRHVRGVNLVIAYLYRFGV